MSIDATIDAIIEPFASKILCSPTSLKLQLLYVIFRDLSQHFGISVDFRRGLYIPQATVNYISHPANEMGTTELQLIADFKHDAACPLTSSTPTKSGEFSSTVLNLESFLRLVDNINRRFFEKKKRTVEFLRNHPT